MSFALTPRVEASIIFAVMDDVKPYFLATLVVGDLQINCYLFGCSATKEAAIIDPGGDAEVIKEAVATHGATVRMILLTHSHFDHIGAVNEIKNEYRCPVLIHRLEADSLTNPLVNLSAWSGESIVCAPADRLLENGDQVNVGKLTLEVLHTPGHTRGSVCFRCDNLLFAGDLLFSGGIGRTDLPGGAFTQMEESIQRKIYTLPDETVVLPGHGESTTVGFEKRHNPFVRAK